MDMDVKHEVKSEEDDELTTEDYDIVIKSETESCPDDVDVDHGVEIVGELESHSLEISREQREEMAKYSAAIGKDLKSKVKELEDEKGFKCKICGFIRMTIESLRAHLSTHRPGNPFRCPGCHKTCPTHAQLTSHIKLHLPPEVEFECEYPNCGAKFRQTSKLKDHHFTHTGLRPWACQVEGCGKGFGVKSGLISHMKTHLKLEERKEFVCVEEGCGVKFVSKAGYLGHMDKHEGNFKSGCHPCYFCNRLFIIPYARDNHMRGHLGEKPYRCNTCGRWLSTKPTLESHKLTHTTYDPFPCPHCPQIFKWKNDLTSHLKRKHSENPRTFKCIHCDYESKAMQDLVRHGRRIHDKLRPFSCSKCSKTFTDKHNMDIHFKVHHTEEREYKCEICGAGFVNATRLRFHSATHSDAKPFKCEICGASYKSQGGRDMHLKGKHGIGKVRMEYNCYFCKKLYHGYSGYLKHIRLHTKECPYPCPQPGCPKARKWLTSAENLKYHLSSVHGIGKPISRLADADAARFQCDKCPRDYKYRPDLLKHQRMVHDKGAVRHKCPEAGCGFLSRNKTILSQHVKGVHLKISHSCAKCGKKHKKKSDLVNHVKKCG